MSDQQIIQQHTPFLLRPAGKDYLWGGRRLKDDFCKNFDLTPLAETWECSTHPDGESAAASGAFADVKLSEILQRFPAMIGSHPVAQDPKGTAEGQLPILIKFIDASKDLSIQVHPDDSYAAEYENGQRGKTEMWYVVDAAAGAGLYYGFNRDMDREQVRSILTGEMQSSEDTESNAGNSAQSGDMSHCPSPALETSARLEEYLQHVLVSKGDVFFIEAGTVHGIGAGSLIVEVQESSNLTYRMYDYHRVGKDGRERELHIEKALAVANLKSSAAPRQPMRVLRYRRGFASELLCRCRYFEVEHLLINTERMRSMAQLQSSGTSFEVLVCVSGCGTILTDTGTGSDAEISGTCSAAHTDDSGQSGNAASLCIPFCQGDSVFVPASSIPFHIHGKAELLRVRC